jgi:hypothetical protein
LQPVRLLAPAERETDMDDFFDDCDGLDWEDWMIIGPLSEDIAVKSEISSGPGGNGMTMRSMSTGSGLIESGRDDRSNQVQATPCEF